MDWDGLSWVFIGGGGVLAAAGVVVLAWALFWDRGRGRRRCPGCWYDMAGVPGVGNPPPPRREASLPGGAPPPSGTGEGGGPAARVEEGRPEACTTDERRLEACTTGEAGGLSAGWVCPECGRGIRREREMGRTRRRWGWAAVALVLGFMGGAAALTPKVAGDGWVGSIPTDVLVRIAPMEELAQFVGTAYIPAKPEPSSVGQALVAEVVKRIRADSLQPRHSRVLMDRYARAFPKVLEELAVTRERWPEGESIWASFEAPWLLIWLHKPTRHLRVRLRRTAAGGPGEWREGSAFFTGLMELGVPAPGPVQVDMEYMADGRVWWRGVVPVTTSVEGELHDVLRPVDRPELGLAIVRWLRLSLVRVESEPRDIMLALVEGPLDDRHIAFGMRADVYADGQLIGTGVYATQRSPPARSRRTVNVRTLVPVVYAPGVELSALPDDCDWEIVIHGDGVVALRDFAAWRPAESNPLHPILFRSRDGTPFVRPSDPEEYWSGQLRLPVRLERWMGPVP